MMALFIKRNVNYILYAVVYFDAMFRCAFDGRPYCRSGRQGKQLFVVACLVHVITQSLCPCIKNDALCNVLYCIVIVWV